MTVNRSPDRRLPVYLLTGYLGSGKTSLLKAWLAQPEFRDAALIINELGEVGLDNQLLAAATELTGEASSLIANACVCCTGLPGLEEALEELFWARLHKRIPPFPCLVIETTGLAEPGPVTQALQSSELLRERYRLAGVITCLSAATADAVLGRHAEARAQLAGTDLLILTKTDLVSPAALRPLQQRLLHQLAHHQSQAQILSSSHASLSAAQMLQSLKDKADQAAHALAPEHPGGPHDVHQHEHNHAAQAFWWSLPAQVEGPALLAQIQALQERLGPALLRLKGRVLTDQGPWLLQMAPFELAPTVVPDALALSIDPKPGLTVIVSVPLSQTQMGFLGQLLGTN